MPNVAPFPYVRARAHAALRGDRPSPAGIRQASAFAAPPTRSFAGSARVPWTTSARCRPQTWSIDTGCLASAIVCQLRFGPLGRSSAPAKFDAFLSNLSNGPFPPWQHSKDASIQRIRRLFIEMKRQFNGPLGPDLKFSCPQESHICLNDLGVAESVMCPQHPFQL